MQKQLPKELNYPDKAWKFDKNSPWVNDLDLNEENAIAIDENLELKSAKNKGVSNINIQIERCDESDISETDVLKSELQPHLGDVDSYNKNALISLKENRAKLQNFKDSYDGYKLIESLQKQPEEMDRAIAKLAYHVIGETKVEMKNL